MSTAGFPDSTVCESRARERAGVPDRVAMAVTGYLAGNMCDLSILGTHSLLPPCISAHESEGMHAWYNIVSEADLRAAAQKTQRYLDTLPVERAQ